MYHRIGDAERDPWNLAVSASHFEEHLQRLRRFGEPMPLDRFAASLREGDSGRPAIVVTFDDGYVDNLLTAAPLLARYAVPATVFVATGYVGANREFWWDELERMLLAPATLPDVLNLHVGDDALSMTLDAARTYSACDRDFDAEWFGHRQGEPSPRFAFFRAVHARLLPAADSARRRTLAEIGEWAAADPAPRASLLCVSRDEARALASAPGMELGAHTVTHPALPTLSVDAQRAEIAASRAAIETLTGKAPTTFAYPFGRQSAESASVVQELGFACACGTEAGVAHSATNLFSLPRLKVVDWDGDAFERALGRWLPAGA
jgi:peptidoglycan/xylan/chitin deacetylase (PgdA/CDA1 family)